MVPQEASTMLFALLLIGGILGFLVILARLSRLQGRVEKLERETGKRSELKVIAHRIEALESQLRSFRAPSDSSRVKTPPEDIESALVMEELQIVEPVPPPSQSVETVAGARQISSVHEPLPRISAVKPPGPSRTREEWESLIGGKWLNRIGALALIIGIGFFLKYAFDRNWITEWMRVLIGGIAGVTLLMGGRQCYRKGLDIFAQGLLGAGVSILYLTVYASFNFYHLVPQGVAFILMSGVTFITISQAFKTDSLAVSLLGWAGGFLTPFLLSTGTANEVGLFSYVAVLDAGLLAVVLKKDHWVVLEPLTFGATFLTFIVWYLRFYAPADLLPTVLFLTLFWGLFYAVDVYRVRRVIGPSPEVTQVIFVLNAVFYYTGIYILINPDHHRWMGLVTLVIGATYFVTVLIVKKLQRGDAWVVVRYILTAIALLVLATTIQFAGFTTVLCWSLEALVILWCGTRWKLTYVWSAALGLFGLGILKFFMTPGAFHYFPVQEFTLFFNQRTFALSLLTATLGAGTLFLRPLSGSSVRRIQSSLHYAWCILLLVLCTVEVTDTFRWWQAGAGASIRTNLGFQRDMILAVIWMVYSLPIAWIGFRRKNLPMVACGLGAVFLSLLLGGVRGFSLEPMRYFVPLFNLRALSLVFLIVGLWTHLRWLKLHPRSYGWTTGMISVLRYSGGVLFFYLCTVETLDHFRWMETRVGRAAYSYLHFMRDMVLPVLWTLYSLVLTGYGLRRRVIPALHCGLGALALAIVWGAVRGVAFIPLERFTLLLNVRSFALGVIIVACFVLASWLRQRRLAFPRVDETLVLLQVVAIVLIFEVITFEIWDFFGKALKESTTILPIFKELNRLKNLRHLVLSGSWLLYSIILLVLGFWRRITRLRIMAIFLLGISVLKIFIYDLSFLETLYRIFSFIGLGLILLIASYLYQRYKAVIFGES
jgi:uncharacterized membrane protein